MTKTAKRPLPAKYLTAEVRRERILNIMPSRDFENMQQLADHMGVHRGFLVNSLKAPGITAATICRLANSLQVSTKWLLER